MSPWRRAVINALAGSSGSPAEVLDAYRAGPLEGAPAETGRWGPSVVFLPNGPVAAALGRLTLEVVEILGEGHWPSGGLGRAHITVRALEPYIESIPQDRAARYVAAMTRALRDIGSARLEVVGVGLSPRGVMACAVSVDGAADRLRHRLNEELGDDGWLERTVFEHGRDPIWYCTLVHFAEPILDPGRLVTWVDQRISWGFGPAIFDSVALCTWFFDGEAMVPRTIASVAATA